MPGLSQALKNLIFTEADIPTLQIQYLSYVALLWGKFRHDYDQNAKKYRYSNSLSSISQLVTNYIMKALPSTI